MHFDLPTDSSSAKMCPISQNITMFFISHNIYLADISRNKLHTLQLMQACKLVVLTFTVLLITFNLKFSYINK